MYCQLKGKKAEMKAWEFFVQNQEAEIGILTVEKWLRTLKVLNFDAGNLYLEAKDSFHALWFEEHMRLKVGKGLVNNNKRKIKVHLSIENEVKKKTSKGPQEKVTKEPSPSPSFNLILDELNLNCTFDNFLVSQTNTLTYQVFFRFIEKSTEEKVAGNPIYVHGSTGSGKTHLLMATADLLRKQGKRVVFARAETFADHVVLAIRAGEMSAFRYAYRNCDVLIIDDVQEFSRKGATQEEFFHTFNNLQMSERQIILSANCFPKELQMIEPRLVSRFEWGIVLSLECPSKMDAETILLQKIKILDYPLDKKIIEFLLDSFSSMTSLNRALEALILRSHLSKSEKKIPAPHLSVLQTGQILEDLLLEEEKISITPERIIHYVAEFFGLKPEDISGKAQTRDCVLPRQISMHLCRTQLKLPYLKIGAVFSKDHSTVMSSVKLIQKEIDADNGDILLAHRAILRKLNTKIVP